MALVTCAGADVLRGTIHLPIRGAWFADLVLDTATAPTGPQTIAADGGLTITGAVVSGGVFVDAAHVRVVGGAGGLGAVVSATYASALVRDVLGFICTRAGETVSPFIDAGLLAQSLGAWSIVESTAGAALDTLADAVGANWRVLADGTIWIGVETWPTATLPDTDQIVEAYPAEGRYVIGADTPSLLPGVALDTVGNVSAVDHWIEPARIRTWATAPATGAPVTQGPAADLQAIVKTGIKMRVATSVDHLALYPAQVMSAAADGSTVDVQPLDSRITPRQGVPLRQIAGCTVVVKAGAVVLIGWEGGDPRKPYALPSFYSGAGVSSVTWAADMVNVGGSGGKAIARTTDKVGADTTMATWISALTSYVNGLAPGTLVLPTDFGKITGGASNAKAK